MKIGANAIRLGNILEHNGKLYIVTKPPEHTMPGKGGAFVQVEMKDVVHGTKVNERFRSSENVERVRLDEKEYQYLYADDQFIIVMDNESFEQISVDKKLLGDKTAYLQENMTITMESYEDKPMKITLPETVVLTVAETEGVVKGQTAASSYKPAIMDNGVRVMVPPFIGIGEKLVIRTEDDMYMERKK